jgi:hypothetical protein
MVVFVSISLEANTTLFASLFTGCANDGVKENKASEIFIIEMVIRLYGLEMKLENYNGV